MDHHFSKRAFFINCTCTLLLVALVGAAYFDISTCPYVYDRPDSISADFSSIGTANESSGGRTWAPNDYQYGSLADSLMQGLTCHMMDICVWVYIIALVVFLTHKYIYYRMQGLHYFFLDYCYFHNLLLVCFLLWRLVDVRWSETPLVSWAAYIPESLRKYTIPSYNLPALNTSNRILDGEFQHALLRSAPVGNSSWVKRIVPRATQGYSLDGLYYPVSVEILSCGYVVAHLTEEEVLSSFIAFFALLAGTFGPILGAIIMWKNALLFYSFDRMSSCYLHLAPAVVQGLLLHRLFMSARRETELVDPAVLYANSVLVAQQHNVSLESVLPALKLLANTTTAAASGAGGSSGFHRQQQKAFTKYAVKHTLEALCGPGTLCYDLRRAVTYTNLLSLHVIMYIMWQVFYHIFNEYRHAHRLRAYKKRMQKLEAQKRDFMRLTHSTEEEAEALRPAMTVSEGVGGDPAARVTAYTWMMEHPPGGKRGIAYRFVTCLGKGRLQTTVLFQISQLIVHMVFFTLHYFAVIYHCFHSVLAAWPLMATVSFYLGVCIYNAACMQKRWISKLQKMAKIGVEAEKANQEAAAAAAAAAGGEKGNASENADKAKKE